MGGNENGTADDFEEPERSAKFERLPKMIREALHAAPRDLTVRGVWNAMIGHFQDTPYIEALTDQIRNWKPKPADGKLLGYRADAIPERDGWRAQVLAVTEYGEIENYYRLACPTREEALKHAIEVATERAAYYNLPTPETPVDTALR